MEKNGKENYLIILSGYEFKTSDQMESVVQKAQTGKKEDNLRQDVNAFKRLIMATIAMIRCEDAAIDLLRLPSRYRFPVKKLN